MGLVGGFIRQYNTEVNRCITAVVFPQFVADAYDIRLEFLFRMGHLLRNSLKLDRPDTANRHTTVMDDAGSHASLYEAYANSGVGAIGYQPILFRSPVMCATWCRPCHA